MKQSRFFVRKHFPTIYKLRGRQFSIERAQVTHADFVETSKLQRVIGIDGGPYVVTVTTVLDLLQETDTRHVREAGLNLSHVGNLRQVRRIQWAHSSIRNRTINTAIIIIIIKSLSQFDSRVPPTDIPLLANYL